MTTTSGGADSRRQFREQRSQHAVAAAVDLAREHGLTVGEPRVLNDLFSLMVHLHPAPVVARVSTCMPKVRSPIGDWMGREIAVTAWLAEQGVPVVTPSGELPPGPHEHGGFPISFWTYLEPDPVRTPTAAEASAMLTDLHATLRSYPGELPQLCADDIPRLMEIMEQTSGVLNQSETDRVRASAERLRDLYEAPTGDLQPLHGDAHPGNLIATRDGLIWIDLEDVCRGPLEWDLVSMTDAGATTDHEPDPTMMARCRELRALQVALCLVAFHDNFGDLEGWDAGLRELLAMLPPASAQP